MPLIKSKSKKAFNENVSAEVHAGKPVKQAVAIAYSVKRKASHKGAHEMKGHHKHHHHKKKAEHHMAKAEHHHMKAKEHMAEMKLEPKEKHISKLKHGAGHKKLHSRTK